MASNFSALRTSREEPSLFEQVRVASQLTPEARYKLTYGASDSQFEKGLRLGAANLTAGSFANEALSREASGDPDWQRYRDLALQTQAQGQMYAPRVSSLRDITSLEDAVDFATGALGQGVMSMAPTLGAALLTRGRGKFANVGSFAGGAATSYNLERGEAALNQYADPTLAATPVEDRDLAATAKGAINAGLDAIVPVGLAGSLARRSSGSLLGHVGRDTLTEGLTEAGQQVVGFGAEKYLDSSRQLEPWDVADALASGALTGGAMSGAVRGAARGAQVLVDRLPGDQQGNVAPSDTGPSGSPPDGIPLPPPESSSLFDAVNDLFGSGTREQAQSTKDYVSDAIDRMSEAATTAQNPSDFLNRVFGSSLDDAVADLRPDTEDPIVLNATDPAAALQQRDAARQQRAARFAEELLNDPATPDAVKERITSFNGDLSSPEAQAYVARNLVSQRMGEKLVNAVADLIDLSKDFGGKFRDALDKGLESAADRIVKKNLQDTTPAEQAAFNKLIFDNLTDEAKANPVVRQRLPEIANALLAFAARTGDLTAADLKTLSRLQDDLVIFRDPDAVATQLAKYANLPRTEDSFLSRIKRVTNAQQDIRRPNSFLYSSLTEEAKETLSQAQLKQLARLVDEFTLIDANKEQSDKVLAGLTAAFGSKENAQAVLDYYYRQNRADLRYAPNEDDEQGTPTENGITERDSAPAPTYHFADAKAMRPFRAFVGRMNNEGGMRRRLRESTLAGVALRRSLPSGARVRPIKMSQYVAETGGNPEAEVRRIAADIKNRIEQHKARKDEDRTKQINELEGELALMRQAYKKGGANAVLDLYEVLQVSGREQEETVATDADIAKMATLANAKDAKDTRITFQRADGSKFTLSAESMWKTLGDKEGSGKGENARVRAKRLFAEAAAAVLARPEVVKIVTPLEKVLIDRKLGVWAKKKDNPEYRAIVTNALKAAENSLKNLQSTLDKVVEEYLEAADNEAKSDEYGSRREEIEAILAQNITQLSERLDAARNGKGPLAGNLPAQAVARQKLRMYREAQGQIDAIKFDEEFDERDNNRSGIPGADEFGPMGPTALPRTRMNEELSNVGPRYAEEDTGLGIGVERRGTRSKVLSDAVLAALYDVAVKGNVARLNTPEKVQRYSAMAREALNQLRQIPEAERTDMQNELLAKLQVENGNAVRKHSFVGAKADPEGAKRAESLAAQGMPADIMWRELGWFRGPDGKLRKEVRSPVLKARVREYVAKLINGQQTNLSLDELFEGVPEFASYVGTGLGRVKVDPTVFRDQYATSIGGLQWDRDAKTGTIELHYIPAKLSVYIDALGVNAVRNAFRTLKALNGGIPVSPAKILAKLQKEHPIPKAELERLTFEKLVSTFMHEMQHAIQMHEGFENGGNHTTAIVAKYGDVNEWLRAQAAGDERKLDELQEQAFDRFIADVGPDADLKAIAHELYKNVIGEVEANDVQARMNLSDEEAKALPPALANAKRQYLRSLQTQIALSYIRGMSFLDGDKSRPDKTNNASAMGPKKGRPGKIDTQKIIDEIRRIRGDKVKVVFQKFSEIGGSGEFSMDKDKTNRLIKIAINASNPMGTAWHEALHDFFAMLDEDRVGRSIKKDLIDAAEAPQVKRRLRELLANHPKALKQIEESPEERVAYMYQFWAEGLLRLGPTGTGIFKRLRQLFRDLFGIVSTHERAEDLLTALHEGRFAEPSVVAEVLADLPGDRFSNKMEKIAPALVDALRKVVNAAPDRLRAYHNDTLTKLADMFSSESGELGFIQKRFQQSNVWENKLAGILAGTTAKERRAALENMQAMKPPSSKLEKELANFFSEMHDYMVAAGVKTFDSKTKQWVPLRKVKNYFPRVFDRQALMADRDGFIALLRKYGNMDPEQANAVFNALVHGNGQLDLAENEHALGFTPYAQAVQDRRLTFINPSNASEFAKYQVKDLADITTNYVKQAVHRAEYARMFGNDGEVIAKMIAESGIKDRKELEDIGKVIQALEGSMGYDMPPTLKELQSTVLTLQNLVVLPLALFSQMIDPIVLAARSEDIKDAGRAYITAIKRLIGKQVDGEELAKMLGIISQESVLEAMGTAYGTAYMSPRMRHINQVFFKYNGMQGWNNSMRIAATVAGERYLIANKNNDRALAELGLTSKDIKIRKNGRLDVSSPKVREALFRFVDQAVLRPSASNRPVWMSDPRFLLVAHLKQFVFAMHNVVLKRANRELAEGNPKPWGVLMLTMPVILAADMAKYALTGGLPSDWGFKDYFVHAVERSGLLGLGDFSVQAMRGVDAGKMPGEALLGPTFEHLMEILRWIGGDSRTSFGDVINRTVPGARFI